MRRIFPKRRQFQFIKHRYVWFGFSGLMILVSIIAMSTLGLQFGVDFTGGTEIDIRAKSSTTIADVRGVMGKYGFSGAQIQQGDKNTFIIRTSSLDDKQMAEIEAALKKDAGLEEVLQINDVGPGWGGQVSRQALIALIIFIIAILIYISFRFEFKMAVCAIIEIIHDSVITVGVYSLSGREVTPATVIAVLTILGYSLYDTIVVFDRIKENTDTLTRQSKKTYTESVNDSVNQVLARSINTSLTTLIPIVSILIFGGATLKAFAFALFIGVLSGTYSSIFLAPPILAMWKETEPKYKAFHQRVERHQARETRVSARKAAGAAESAKVGPKPKPLAASKAAQGGAVLKGPGGKAAGKAAAAKAAPKAGAKAQPGPGAAAAQPGGEAPKPKPRPKTASAAGKAAGTGKGSSAAKSRTRGPGAGKKKKKK